MQQNMTQAVGAIPGVFAGQVVAPPIKYCLYARKSTEQDELQALSIDSQIKEMMETAQRDGLDVVEVRRESHSAKDSGQRPIFSQLLADIRARLFNGILSWAPDRLSRNAGDLGSVVDLMDQGLLHEIRTYGQKFSNSPNEKFLLMILCSQAKLENDNKGINVKRGLRAKCEQGWRPGMAPIGYIHDKFAEKGQKRVLIDTARAPVIKQLFEKVAYDNASGRTLAKWLDDIKFTTRTGHKLTLSGIYRVLNESFFYGEFEFPRESGKLYKGGHDAIISRELFMKARENLTAPPRRHPGTVDFAFTKMFHCGACGSGISAEEKFKHQKNGDVHRYVYYLCSKGSDRNCKEKLIREEDLIEQLVQAMDKIEFDEKASMQKFEAEIKKYNRLTQMMFGDKFIKEQKGKNIDLKSYAKYILREGTKEEKRDILLSLKTEIFIKGKEIVIK